MAAASRTTTHTVEWLTALEAAPHRFGFYAAMRRLECLYAEKPRIGRAARPADEAVRLGQKPALAFASSTLAGYRQGGAESPGHLAQYFFGLFGPNGPLPLHLSEYAYGRELNYGDGAFRAFADVFHHRLLALFYRAWADAQPTVSLDRPANRRFNVFLGSLVGIAAPEFRHRETVPHEARLALAGRFALGTRPVEGLAGLLGDFFGFEFRVREFACEWLRLARDDRLVLGGGEEASMLGRGTVLGRAVYSGGHAFQLVCGPLDFAQFARLLPGRPSLERLRDLVRAYDGDELRCTLRLVLRADEVPECRLGAAGPSGMTARLGWTSWLGRRRTHEAADNVVIDPAWAATASAG